MDGRAFEWCSGKLTLNWITSNSKFMSANSPFFTAANTHLIENVFTTSIQHCPQQNFGTSSSHQDKLFHCEQNIA
jgi:hypothetical protein